jgi:hypothetical protein
MLANPPGPLVGPPTRLHAHEGWRARGAPVAPRPTGHTLAAPHGPRVIPADEVQHEVRDVEAESVERLGHRTRLLLVHG